MMNLNGRYPHLINGNYSSTSDFPKEYIWVDNIMMLNLVLVEV